MMVESSADGFLKLSKDGASIVTSSTNSWNRSQTLLLITELEKYPCLYELEDPNYKNERKRRESLEFILAKLKKIKPMVTIRCIKHKIKSLRSQLHRERKNFKKYNTDNMEYVPTLWCFNKISFLYNSMFAREPSLPMMKASEDSEMENNDSSMRDVEHNDGSPSFEAKWKPEEVILFLKELEKYPCLYSPTDNYFANKRKRDEQLNILLPAVKKIKSDVTINGIVNKIRSLQGQICKEKRALRETRPGEVYKPRLWCYNELSFMINCRDLTSDCSIGSSNLDLSDRLSEEDDDEDDEEAKDQYLMVDSVWNRKQTLLLISELQKYPCLYNSADKSFTNRQIRNSKLNLILPVIKQCKPDVTLTNIKKKIKTLQGQLNKEKKYKNKAEAKGEEYIPKLWCYNQLLFIFECNKFEPSYSEKYLSEESIEVPSEQLNDDDPFKIEETFDEYEPDALSKPNPPDIELEVKSVSNDAFQLESQSNECSEVESLPKDDSEESNSDIQNVFQEEDFFRYLRSQFKKIQSDDNLEDLKLETLQLVSRKIKKEKRLKQQKKYFEFRPVQATEINPDAQTASSYSHSSHLINQPVSSKVKSETKKSTNCSSTSGSMYSTAHQICTSYIPVDKIANDSRKRTFMPILHKILTKEATTKRKKMSSPSLSSPPDLPTKDPLALAVDDLLLDEYLDYQ